MTPDTYSFAERKGAAGGALFLTFHGTGGDEHQFTGLAAQLMPDATIVSPRGDVSEYGAARFFRRTGEGVYDMADLTIRTEKMKRFVSGLKAGHSPSRVIGLGYSNGANILASVLFGEAGLFDDAILMHPLIPFEPPENPGLAAARILITAGRNDPICPPSLTERLGGYFRRQGAELHLKWHDGGHGIEPGEIAAVRDFLARNQAPAR
ncbi:MAG: alpha/beta hydrolase [Hyphomicrobiales bacterium]|nr:alpha/beta hydrolase [Hyphomicrobiales bacterium]